MGPSGHAKDMSDCPEYWYVDCVGFGTRGGVGPARGSVIHKHVSANLERVTKGAHTWRRLVHAGVARHGLWWTAAILGCTGRLGGCWRGAAPSCRGLGRTAPSSTGLGRTACTSIGAGCCRRAGGSAWSWCRTAVHRSVEVQHAGSGATGCQANRLGPLIIAVIETAHKDLAISR